MKCGVVQHKDIAFEFGSYISAEFKLLIIKEFQRLKTKESESEQWDYRRFLTKVNYKLQTDAVRDVLLPLTTALEGKEGLVYAGEADVINIALFGTTAKIWRDNNPKKAKKGNVRDFATIEQLTVLANLESLNSMLIIDGLDKTERFAKLRSEAQRQISALLASKLRLVPKEEPPERMGLAG